MKYTLSITELLKRNNIREGQAFEYLNRMSDEEENIFRKEIEIITNGNENEIIEKMIDRDIIFKVLQMKKIYTKLAISGKIGSGKTTLSNLLKKKLEEKGNTVKEINFADKLKKFCYELTGYYGYTQEEKNIYLEDYEKTVGQCLQEIGTNAMRDNFHKDVWVLSTFKEMKKEVGSIFIIGDCRFPNEADFCKKNDVLLIRLEGDPANVRKESKRDLTHPSETALDNYQYWDQYFMNDRSLKELEAFADYVLKLHF